MHVSSDILLTFKVQTVSVEDVKEKFVILARNNFVVRCQCLVSPSDSTELDIPEFENSEDINLFQIPEIRLHLIAKKKDESEEPAAKRIKVDESELQPDRGIYWRVNFDRFDRHFRDEAIISAITNRVNHEAGAIVRAILRLSESKTHPSASTSGDVSRFDIFDAVRKDAKMTEKELDSYLTLLTEDESNIVSKSDERGGGMYVVNLHRTLKSLAETAVTTVVQDRFGSKCCRIFRLLLKEHYLEQKQIEEVAMIPAKDAKEITYYVFMENFISLREISRTPDYAVARTFYLFHVRLNALCRMLLERCYTAVANVMSRRSHENNENKRLLEKSQRVDAMVSILQRGENDPTQIQEIQETITPPEREQLKEVNRIVKKLEHSELQIDETIFILKSWLSVCIGQQK